MRRKLLSIVLALTMALGLLPAAAFAADESVAEMDGASYSSLAEAIAAVPTDGTEKLIKITKDIDNASGITIPAGKKFTVDFDGHTYTLDGPGAGSSGTKTNAFQLLYDSKTDTYSTITFKNGTINIAEKNLTGAVYGKDSSGNYYNIMRIIQGYANVTLEDMDIDATNIYAQSGKPADSDYILSFNKGTVNIIGETNIKGFKGHIAFDSCDGTWAPSGVYDTEPVTKVNVNTTGTITGDIEVWGGKLTIENATVLGTVKESKTGIIEITGGNFTGDVSALLGSDYIQTEDGTVEPLSVDNAVAKIGETPYKTLAAAVAAVHEKTGDERIQTIELLKDTTGSGFGVGYNTIENGTTKGNNPVHIVINMNGHTYNMVAPTVGSAGTETNGFQFLKDSDVIFKNGTIRVANDLRCAYLFQNYANLTLEDMDVSIKGNLPCESLVHSMNGTVNIIGKTILTAGDTYTWSASDTGDQKVIDVMDWNNSSYSGGTQVTVNTTGVITGKINAGYYTKDLTQSSGKSVLTIENGQFVGDIVQESSSGNFTATKISISGGLFSTAPEKTYLAKGHFIDATTDSNYPYCVTDQQPESAPIAVTENTEAKLAEGDTVKDADKTAITDALNSGKTSVDGVADAVAPDSRVEIAQKSGVVDADLDNNENMITVDIKVDVTVTASDLENGTLTFAATPVATVKVNGNEQKDENNEVVTVSVTNDMLTGDPITVKLPLPSSFTPKQIKHTSSDRSVEYFINKDEGTKRGAKFFTIEDGCAVFTITKFSTFELSGDITYVAPSSGSTRYNVTVDSAEHGSVSASSTRASRGTTVTLTVKPDSGYVLETLTVLDKSGKEVTVTEKDGKYTFTMPAGDVTVKATFMEDNTLLNFFYDVPNSAYYYDAVKWAVEKGVTNGIGDNLFGPDAPCTRAQIVTFLWKAAGSPVVNYAMNFSDVAESSWYAEAVRWAVSEGITAGTTDTTFSPDASCTRAQAAVFLYRYMQTQGKGFTGAWMFRLPFTDVPEWAYESVAWCYMNGVTAGVSEELFGSDNACTRAQIVTFLFKACQVQ